MKIFAVRPFSTNFPKRKPSSFSASKPNADKGDCFSSSSDYKYVKIKDLENGDFYAIISKRSPSIPYGHNAFEYVIEHNHKDLGYAIALDRAGYDGLYLSDIYTQENGFRQYKGLGTQLLKCIVQESYKKGFGGKILCCAYHKDSPFIFYYKNNFKICDNQNGIIENPTLYNAPLHYAAINNLEVFSIMPQGCELLHFELDKKGADALMKNKRLYKDVICDDVGYTEINGKRYSAQYIKFPDDNKSYLQILNEDAPYAKLALILALEKTVDFQGRASFKIVQKEENPFHYSKEVGDFAKSLADDLAQKYL